MFPPNLAENVLLNVFVCLFPQLAPTCSASVVNSMKIVENPVSTCDQVYTLIQSLTAQIRKRLEDPKSAGGVVLTRIIF